MEPALLVTAAEVSAVVAGVVTEVDGGSFFAKRNSCPTSGYCGACMTSKVERAIRHANIMQCPRTHTTRTADRPSARQIISFCLVFKAEERQIFLGIFIRVPAPAIKTCPLGPMIGGRHNAH